MEKAAWRTGCQPSLAPCPAGGASPGACPTERLGGWGPGQHCSLAGHSGDIPAVGQEQPVEMCGALSGAGPTESLRKADLGNTS